MKREQEPQKRENSNSEYRKKLLDKMTKGEELSDIECHKIAYSVADGIVEQLAVIHNSPHVIAYPEDLKLSLDKEVFGQRIQWSESSRLNYHDKVQNLSIVDKNSATKRYMHLLRQSPAMFDLPKVDRDLHLWLAQLPCDTSGEKVCRGVITVQGRYFLCDFTNGYTHEFLERFNIRQSDVIVVPEAPNKLMFPHMLIAALMPALEVLNMQQPLLHFYFVTMVMGYFISGYPVSGGKHVPPYSYNRDKMEVYDWRLINFSAQKLQQYLLEASVVGLDISSKLKVTQEAKVTVPSFALNPSLG